MYVKYVIVYLDDSLWPFRLHKGNHFVSMWRRPRDFNLQGVSKTKLILQVLGGTEASKLTIQHNCHSCTESFTLSHAKQ